MRRYSSFLFALVLVVGLSLVTAVPVRAATLEVGTGKTYNTIQDAIDAAGTGDTIVVYASLSPYTEDLDIPTGKDNLELKPADGESVTIKAVATEPDASFPLAVPNIDILSPGVKIHGFTIEGPDAVANKYASGMLIGASNVEIYDNDFKVTAGRDTWTGPVSTGIVTYRKTATGMENVDISGLNIHDNTFTNYGTGAAGFDAIFVNRDTGTGTITIADNEFTGNIARAISVERSNVVISGNTVTTDLAPYTASAGGYQGMFIGCFEIEGGYPAQSDVSITGNTVNGSTTSDGFAQGIRVGHTQQTFLSNMVVSRNTVQNCDEGITVRADASGVTVNYNNIIDNTVGVQNDDAGVQLDAENNWWGDASGPTHSGNPGGTGDAVSDDVDYTPWLGEEYAPTKSVATATGTGTASFSPDSGASENLTAVDEGTLPTAGKPDLIFSHGFFSFKITGLSTGQTVIVTIVLPSAVSIGIQYWKYHPSEGGWIQIPMGDDDGDNMITITLVDGGLGDDDALANGVIIDQGGAGSPPSRVVGGGGGIKPPPGTTWVYDVVNSKGEFTEDVSVESEDGNVELAIDEGTVGLTEKGKKLMAISIDEMEAPTDPPKESNRIGLTYDLEPDGATFDPPISLTFHYDPDEIPEGVSEENLVIAMWDEEAGEWVDLVCTVDPETNTITASVSHFTAFTVVAYTHPAAFETSYLMILPGEVDPDEKVTIGVKVTNTGDLSGSYEVTLKIDNVVVDTKDVTLAGGASQKVAFTTSKDVAGTYNVNVNGLSGTFIVKPALAVAPPAPPAPAPAPPAPAPPAPSPAAPPNWGLIGGIITGCVIAIGLLVYLFVWRKRSAPRLS